MKMIDFALPRGWRISFPRGWKHEGSTGDDADVFYPLDSDLTVYATVFSAADKDSLISAEKMREAFLETVDESAAAVQIALNIPEGFSADIYETKETENDQTIYRMMAGLVKEGILISLNFYSVSRQEILDILPCIETLRQQ